MASFDYASNLVLRIAYPTVAARKRRIQRKQVDNILYLAELRTLNPWALIGSLAVVSVFLLVLIAIPLFDLEPLPKREAVTMLYLPPPPAAGGKAIKLQAPATHAPATIAIPAPVHATREAATAAKTEDVIGGVPGGVAGGIPDGVLGEGLGGPLSMPLPAKTPQPTPMKRIRVASGVAEAHLIHEVQPEYPRDAGRERIEGTVVLLAVIGPDGIVQDVQVVSGLPVLAQAAIQAVKQWRYKPYLLNGAAVEIDSRITINFTMSRG